MKINLNKLISVFTMMIITSFLLLVACKKQETSSTETDKPPSSISFDDFEFSGIFRGSLYSAGSSSPIEGYVTIEASGATTLDLLSGRMKGTSVKANGNYNITITQVTGIFQNVSNITGTIEISTRTLYLSGTDADGNPVTLGGTTPPVMTTGGWENLTKSAIFFTHNESCKASITIDGITLSGLNKHYETGGLCSPTYDLWNTIRFNFDNNQSQIYCHDIKLLMLNGQYSTFTDCNTTAFYLNKNTSYNYTVNWDNGETSFGTFTSPSSGGQLPICISNNGPECDYSLNGKWLASDGTGIDISGLTGTFYAFSSYWQLFVNNGTVSVGSSKIRNISQVNSTTWNCQVLFLRIVNGQPVSVAWSTDGTIKMNTSGSSITITATDPFGGGTGSATHTRVK